MIQPHELTIGSYFTPTSNKKILIPSGEPLKVGALLFDGVQVIDPHRADMPVYKYKEIFGIPLTPDLLVKAGFVKEMHNPKYDFFGYRLNNTILYRVNFGNPTNEDWGWEIEHGYTYEERTPLNRRIDYLHQLQQIIFVLTGEPLQIKI